jgi:8-oxo-dGTP pyrophosphatase MutT (NUDIX family)
MPPVPRWRPTARLLVVDPLDRVLLLRFRGRQGEAWLTPGGGIHRDESVTAAAVRELAEETGYVTDEDALGPIVATRAGLSPYPDWAGRMVFGADSYFLVRVTDPEAVSTAGHEEHERSLIIGHRWWTVAEMRATDEVITPPGLAGLMARLLADGVPARPVRLRWRQAG